MRTATTADLSYPIGKFNYAGPYQQEQRRQFIDEIAAAPQRLRAAVEGLSEAQLDTPYRPGGWTVRQLVHHVADSHMNAYIRMKLALTEATPLLKTYEQDLWVRLPDVKLGVETSLVLLEALHVRLAALLRAMRAEEFERTARHPEWGEIAVDFLLAQYAWHGKHHVAHVTSLRKRMGWE